MLNEEQLRAVECNDSFVLINASAGTGKTTTLIEAARRHIMNGGAKSVVITFTNAAADELKIKLGLGCEFVGTIHKFAIKVIYEMAAQYHFRVNFLNRDQIETIIYQLLKEKEMDLSNFEFKKCLFYITNKKRFLELYDHVPSYFEEIEEDYKIFKKKINAFDYTDSPEYLVLKLRDYEWTTEYDGLFVDEAQDLSPEQYTICQTMKAKKKFIIGDPRQSIYLFRGAAPEVFFAFQKDGYTYFTLHQNYRSYQEILDEANADLIAIRGHGGPDVICHDFATIFKHHPRILCRTNKQVNEIETLYSNVSTIHKAKGLEFSYVVYVNFPTYREEDENIEFVGLTRAKNGLMRCDFDNLINYLEVHPEKEDYIIF